MMRTALVTYLYPSCVKFSNKFVGHLNQIEEKDFEVIVFNDGVEDAGVYFTSLNHKLSIIEVNGSINYIRYSSFEILTQLDLDVYIFQDFDDLFSLNRISTSKRLLQSFDIVCNDIDVVFKNCKLPNYWRQRIEDMKQIDAKFIRRCNIIGLGNTSVRKEVLTQRTYFSEIPLAYDWFYFYQILSTKSYKAVFTHQCRTDYFQHENNIAGLGKELSNIRIEYIINVKMRHYEALVTAGYRDLEPELRVFKNINGSKKKLENLPAKNYFWWEEI